MVGNNHSITLGWEYVRIVHIGSFANALETNWVSPDDQRNNSRLATMLCTVIVKSAKQDTDTLKWKWKVSVGFWVHLTSLVALGERLHPHVYDPHRSHRTSPICVLFLLLPVGTTKGTIEYAEGRRFCVYERWGRWMQVKRYANFCAKLFHLPTFSSNGERSVGIHACCKK